HQTRPEAGGDVFLKGPAGVVGALNHHAVCRGAENVVVAGQVPGDRLGVGVQAVDQGVSFEGHGFSFLGLGVSASRASNLSARPCQPAATSRQRWAHSTSASRSLRKTFSSRMSTTIVSLLPSYSKLTR